MDESPQPVQAQITPDTEIRKLRPSELNKIAWHLTTLDSWKRLMLDSSSGDGNLFNLDQVRCIERESKLKQISAAEIFLNEWGTWGKKRPTCKQLMSMCIEMQNYRAADYLAEILKIDKPSRPDIGPAAPVDMAEFEERLKLFELMKDQEKLPTSDVEKSPKKNNEMTTEQSLATVKSIFNLQKVKPKPEGLKLANKMEERKAKTAKRKVHEVFPEPDDEEVEGIKYLLEQPILTDLIKLSNVNLSAADNIQGDMIPILSDFMKFSDVPIDINQDLGNYYPQLPVVVAATPKKDKISNVNTNIPAPSLPDDNLSTPQSRQEERTVKDILDLPQEIINEMKTSDIPLFVLEEAMKKPKDVTGALLQVLTPEQRDAAREYNELFDPNVPLSVIEKKWRKANVASESLIQKTIERLQDLRLADKLEQDMHSIRMEHKRKIAEQNALKINAIQLNENGKPDNNSLSQEEEKLGETKVAPCIIENASQKRKRLRDEFFKSLLSDQLTSNTDINTLSPKVSPCNSSRSYVSPDIINKILDNVDHETKKLGISSEKKFTEQDEKSQKEEFSMSSTLDESKDSSIKIDDLSQLSFIPLDDEQRTLDSIEREMIELKGDYKKNMEQCKASNFTDETSQKRSTNNQNEESSKSPVRDERKAEKFINDNNYLLNSHKTNGYTSPLSSPSADSPRETSKGSMFALEQMLAKSINFQKKMALEKQIMAEALNSHNSNASSSSAQSLSPSKHNYKEKNAVEFPLSIIDEAKEASIFSDASNPNPHHYLGTKNNNDKIIINKTDEIPRKEISKSKTDENISELEISPDPDSLPDLVPITPDISCEDLDSSSKVDVTIISTEEPTSSENEIVLSNASYDVVHSPTMLSKQVAEAIINNESSSSEEIDDELLPVIVQNFNKNILK